MAVSSDVYTVATPKVEADFFHYCTLPLCRLVWWVPGAGGATRSLEGGTAAGSSAADAGSRQRYSWRQRDAGNKTHSRVREIR